MIKLDPIHILSDALGAVRADPTIPAELKMRLCRTLTNAAFAGTLNPQRIFSDALRAVRADPTIPAELRERIGLTLTAAAFGAHSDGGITADFDL